MNSDHFDLEARLLPERIRLDLARIGALLATEQLLSGLVVDNLAGFLDPTAPMALDGYRQRPAAWESRFDESLEWLVQHEALSPQDAEVVRQVREHACQLMADVPSYLLSDEKTVPVGLLVVAAEVVDRLNLFWGRIVIDSNPDFDGREIQDEEIQGGASALVRLLLSAVNQP